MNNVPTQTHAGDTLLAPEPCDWCNNRDTQVWGCLISLKCGENICTCCCGCPDHENYWGQKCCQADYFDPQCDCCKNTCDRCSED